jgi:hypothetical protein
MGLPVVIIIIDGVVLPAYDLPSDGGECLRVGACHVVVIDGRWYSCLAFDVARV